MVITENVLKKYSRAAGERSQLVNVDAIAERERISTVTVGRIRPSVKPNFTTLSPTAIVVILNGL
jgi:hypothetical protein